MLEGKANMENKEKELEERELKELELMNENENREFYVYLHIRLDNMTPFYVGKGKRDRAYDLDRSDFHNSVRDEYDCKVVIIKDKLTESQAFRLEKRMIEYYVLTLGYGIPIKGYDNYDHDLPYLTNFTWGGEGASGYKHSEETKLKMSESQRGKHLSDESKLKMSESHSKKVICITTGKTFNSLKEASNCYNVAISNISRCCGGTRKSAGKLNGIKLQWKYAENDDNNDLKVV